VETAGGDGNQSGRVCHHLVSSKLLKQIYLLQANPFCRNSYILKPSQEEMEWGGWLGMKEDPFFSQVCNITTVGFPLVRDDRRLLVSHNFATIQPWVYP
jgi:hypothetical protein